MDARSRSTLQWVLIAIVVVGLGIDAFVHFDLASAFKNNKTSVLSEADLFRAEAVVSLVAALAVLIRPRTYTALFAFLVAAGGTVAVVLYRYVDVGAFGPIPNMYDPYWVPVGKWLSALGEVAAAIAALALFATMRSRTRHGVRPPARTAINNRA